MCGNRPVTGAMWYVGYGAVNGAHVVVGWVENRNSLFDAGPILVLFN